MVHICDIMMITRYWIPEYFGLKPHVYGHLEHEINSACMQAMSKRYFNSFILIIVNYHVKLSCSCHKF